MKIEIEVKWDWSIFALGFAYDKPYKCFMVILGCFVISFMKGE